MARSDHPLRRWLVTHARSQKDLAAEIGYSAGRISEWIHAERYPPFEALIAIFEATNGQITPNDFLPVNLRRLLK